MGTNSQSEQFCKLFIGGLHYKTTEETMRAHFEQWGEIVDCVVVKDSATRKSRGFGFITYKEAEMVDAAQNARPHTIDARSVETKRAVPREDSGKPESQATVKKIFIGGLRDDVEDETLQEYFSTFGKITNINIVKDKATQKKRGFAFVEFDDYDAVDKIVLQKHHALNGKKSEVKKALSKQEMDKMHSKSQGRGGDRNSGSGMPRGNRGGGGDWNNGNSGYGNEYGNQGGGGGNYGGGNGGGYHSGGGANNGGGGGYNSYNNNNNNGPWSQQGGGGGGGGNNGNSAWSNGFGQGYGSSYGGGPVRSGGSYGGNQRGSGPYGGGNAKRPMGDHHEPRIQNDYNHAPANYGGSGGGSGNFRQ